MKAGSAIIELKSREFVDLDPTDFLRSLEEDRKKYKSFEIIPPRLDGDDFGKIRATLTTPVYAAG